MKIDNGSDVMNTISHRVYQTGEGERESDRPRTSENQAKDNRAVRDMLSSADRVALLHVTLSKQKSKPFNKIRQEAGI